MWLCGKVGGCANVRMIGYADVQREGYADL